MAIIFLLILSLGYHIQIGRCDSGTMCGQQDHTHYVAEGI